MKKPSIEQINNAEPFAVISDAQDSEQVVKMMDLEFPGPGSSRRELCMAHLREGVAAELQQEFLIGGYDFRNGEDLVVQLSCKGLGCFARLRHKNCALTMTQYDENGEKLSEMEADYEV